MKVSQINLPLSWTHLPGEILVESVDLSPFNSKWLATGDLQASNFISFIEDYISRNSNRFVIRGCSEAAAGNLQHLGFETLLTAKEAIFVKERNHFHKKSIRELIRRGQKFGKLKKYHFNEEVRSRFSEFKNKTKHAEEPQLKFLYQTDFKEHMKMFTLENSNGEWLGAITVSQNTDKKVQAESMLKRLNAPNGTMEALLYLTIREMLDSGFEQFSLGEVPFLINKSKLNPLSKAGMLNRLGRSAKFGYNFEGLYFFKNKFSPHWKNVYLCAYPKVYFRDLFVMAFKSKLIHLLFHKVFEIKQIK